MTGEFGLAGRKDSWRPHLGDDRRCEVDDFLDRFADQAKPDLPPPGQLDIDLRQKLGVEQRAVMDAVAAIDAVARAQGVEAVFGAGMARAGEHDGVDHPGHAHLGAAAALQLAVEEAEVEARIVRHERRVAEKFEQRIDLRAEQRLVRQERVAQPVDALRLRPSDEAPWPQEDNPMYRYLVERAGELADSDDLAAAMQWLASRAWFEATLADMMKGSFAVVKGPLKNNKGDVVVSSGQAFVETAIELESMNYLVEGVIGSTS